MAKVVFGAWKVSALGHILSIDNNNSVDCVDVPKSWAEFGTGVRWQDSIGWGNAKDIWYNAPSKYWDRISKSQGPKVGDVVCMDGTIGGGYGHTGVVVAVIGNNIIIYQQNTFTQQPVYTGTYSANASYIQGYLRPKFSFVIDAPSLESYQRVTNDVVNYRSQSSRAGSVIKQFGAGEVIDFKGYVKGESVDGNDIWFVGMHTGGFIWSGGLTDMSTSGLADLTPVHNLKGYQRQIGDDAMNYRRAPQVAPDNVIQIFPAGDVLDFKGWVHGQNIDGNDIWFVGKYSGGYVHSGGFKDSGTHDLPELTETPTPTTPVEPAYTFSKSLACVTRVVPAGYKCFEHGNFPEKPAKAVIHDFGTKGVDTLQTVLSWFQKTDNVAAHFVVSGKEIVQMVSLDDRAYHAGPTGNIYVGIETDPAQDADTIASTKLLLRQLRDKYGYQLELIKHSSLMATNCGDDVNLENYDITEPVKPSEPVEEDKISAEEFRRIITNIVVTFFQAFTATWALTGYRADKGAIGGAIGAALSAVWNTIIKPWWDSNKK